MKTANKYFGLFIAAALAFAMLAAASCAAPQKSSENRPPVITQLGGATDWAPLTEGQFSVTASDPDNDKLSYSWAADNGTLKASGDTAIWTSPAEMGKYKITATVNDGHGHEVSLVKEVRVFVNSDGSQTPDPPILLKMSWPASENSTGAKRIRIWTSAPVECVVSGVAPQDLKYEWTASNGRIQGKGLSDGTATRVTWIAPGVAGDYTLDVLVTDGQGNKGRGTVNFKVFCCGN